MLASLVLLVTREEREETSQNKTRLYKTIKDKTRRQTVFLVTRDEGNETRRNKTRQDNTKRYKTRRDG